MCDKQTRDDNFVTVDNFRIALVHLFVRSGGIRIFIKHMKTFKLGRLIAYLNKKSNLS